MAIYHLTVKNGSRAGGQSAHAHARYIARDGKYSRPDRDGAARDPLLYSESAHMPAWAAGEPLTYWEAADTYERANGQLYKEVEFALPAELSAAEQQAAASAFAQALTAAEQLPYSLAIHAGQGTNPHCHLMISERANDGIEREADEWFKRANRAEPERGGALKTRTLQTKDWLLTTREAWAAEANQALERADEPERIDHRSYADQGIEREPGVYVNATVRAMEARGIETDRGNAAREVAAAARQLDELAAQEAALLEERASLIAAAAIAASPVPPSRDEMAAIYTRFGADRPARERDPDAPSHPEAPAPARPAAMEIEREPAQEAPPPAPQPTAWETVKERVGSWFSREQTPEAVPTLPAAQDAPSAAQDGPRPSSPAPDPAEAENAAPEPLSVDEAYRRETERAHEARQLAAEVVENYEAVAAQVAAIKDPERRAAAERLLETVRREETARRASLQQEPERGRDRDEGWER